MKQTIDTIVFKQREHEHKLNLKFKAEREKEVAEKCSAMNENYLQTKVEADGRLNDRTSFYNKQLEEQEKMFERRLREADERENALNLKLCELEALKEKSHNQQKIIDAFGRTEF